MQVTAFGMELTRQHADYKLYIADIVTCLTTLMASCDLIIRGCWPVHDAHELT